MNKEIIDWLRLFRAQTAPATILLLLVPYLAGEHSTFIGATVLTLFGLLTHFWSFGQNSLLDTTITHFREKKPPDLDDPAKRHHPLVSGQIKFSTAHSVINWGLAILVTVAGIWSLLGANPILSMFSLIVWVIWGWSYNAGLSKVSLWGFIPITICFVGLTGWSWFLSHKTIDLLGWWYLAYVFTVILFQISWSGHLKEMGQAERSNLLIKMGARLVADWFKPGWALFYGLGIKIAGVVVLGRILQLNFTLIGVVWYVLIFVLTGVMIGLLCFPHTYVREKELKRMSLMEIISIYAPIPLMLPWVDATVLMILGVIYFVGVNRALWGVSYPKV